MNIGTRVWDVETTDPDYPGGKVARRPDTDAAAPDDGMVYVRWASGYGRWEYIEDLTTTPPPAE